jgi:hypothetical protein
MMVGALRTEPYISDVAYWVLIDDNFHYQDESERIAYDQFETTDEAVAACRAIVE